MSEYQAKEITKKLGEFIKSKTDSKIKNRGYNYFLGGNIIDISYEKRFNQFKFLIKGSAIYQCVYSLNINSEVLESNCNCPYDDFCKHQAAAAYWLIEKKSELIKLLDDKDLTTKQSNKPEPKLKPKDKPKIKPRNSFEPFLIENYLHLNTQSLYKNYISNDTQQVNLLNYIFLRTDKSTYEGSSYYQEGFSWYRDPIKEFKIVLKHQDDGLLVSCSCNVRVKKLCSHAYALIGELIQDGNIKNIKDKPQKEIEEHFQRVAKKYGVEGIKNHEEYFQYAMGSRDFGLTPVGEFKNLISPDYLDKIELTEQLKHNPEAQLQIKSQHQQKETFQLGFAFWFSDTTEQFHLNPLMGTSGRKEQPMEVKLQRYNPHAFVDLDYQFGDHSLIELCEVLERSKINEDYHIENQIDRMSNYIDILAKHPFLYLNTSHYWDDVKKSQLKKVFFNDKPPQVLIEVIQEGEFIKQKSFVIHNDKKISIDHKAVQFLNSLFVLIDDQIHFFPNPQEIATWDSLMLMNEKKYSANKFPEVFEKQLQHIGKNKDIEFKKLKDFEVKKKKIKPIEKELYLTELDDFVIFRPYIRFDDDSLIEAKTESASLSISGKTITQNNFDKQIALDFLSLIENLHSKFKKQKMASFHHLTYKEMMEGNAFLKIFNQLSEEGIKVFGLKNLKKLKVNPHTARVKYSVESNMDWFDVKGGVYFGDEFIAIKDLKKKFVPGAAFIELSDGKNGIIPDEWLKKLEKLFLHTETENGELKLSKKHFNLVDTLFENLENEEVLAEIIDRRSKLLNFQQLNLYSLPENVNATLRHYQEDGFQWLCFLDEFKWGGILADDMGLGKTLQVITFLSHIIDKNKQTNLIVVPTSLLFNWENELKKFAAGLSAHFYYGSNRIKSTEEFDQYDIIFTSYGLMLSDIELLKDYAFNYVILDESQAIKNASSKRYKAARLLQANNRIAMTGTPVENNTFDLYAQMSFLNPGFLGNAKSFKNNYANEIDNKRDQQKAADLQQMIKPFVLRRTKEQVATELPDKIEDVLYCEMGKAQRKVYDAVRNDIRDNLLEKMEEEGLEKARFSVLEGLTKLRLVCDTPEILSGQEKYSNESAKIELLIQHIKDNTPNHKILIFSQFVKMLHVIEKHLQKEEMDYAYLDGQSSQKQRRDNVDKFQQEEDCRLFLISLKAGGTGLNLMAADYVYIVDPWWNPAVENQAIDRCYRIGQDKKVIAYRMICKDTIEEKIMDLKSRKTAIAGDIISTDENTLKQLDKDDILALFS